MIKEKLYKGVLNVEEKSVYIDTDIQIRTVTIHYLGQLIVKKQQNILNGNNKLLIMNFTDKKLDRLFEYKGMALFSKCIVADVKRAKHNIPINKLSLEKWNTLDKTIKSGTNLELVQSWESLTRYWENMGYNGNNNRKPYTHTFLSYDNETKKFTRNKEIRKK